MKTREEPAFPRAGNIHDGLTKREWFAGLAMQGLLSSPDTKDATTSLLAEDSVALADALIAELERTR